MTVQIINVKDDSIIECYDTHVIESANYIPHLHVGDAITTISGLHGIITFKELDVFRKIIRIFLSLTIDRKEDLSHELPQQRNGE